GFRVHGVYRLLRNACYAPLRVRFRLGPCAPHARGRGFKSLCAHHSGFAFPHESAGLCPPARRGPLPLQTAGNRPLGQSCDTVLTRSPRGASRRASTEFATPRAASATGRLEASIGGVWAVFAGALVSFLGLTCLAV